MSLANIRIVDMEIAYSIDDVRQATKFLQDLADFRPARDVASHFIPEEQWKTARRAERVELLRGWLKAEKAYDND